MISGRKKILLTKARTKKESKRTALPRSDHREICAAAKKRCYGERTARHLTIFLEKKESGLRSSSRGALRKGRATLRAPSRVRQPRQRTWESTRIDPERVKAYCSSYNTIVPEGKERRRTRRTATREPPSGSRQTLRNRRRILNRG